ncbi:MAG TPA: hypothetical protein VN886_06105 [Acidimicrobiales bacterium]|nr:hypothetical protein [Acidimicrobiales bacterium]
MTDTTEADRLGAIEAQLAQLAKTATPIDPTQKATFGEWRQTLEQRQETARAERIRRERAEGERRAAEWERDRPRRERIQKEIDKFDAMIADTEAKVRVLQERRGQLVTEMSRVPAEMERR